LSEVGNGAVFGEAEGTSRVLCFEFCQGVGEKWGEGGGVFEVDRLEGKAALLIEECDVLGC